MPEEPDLKQVLAELKKVSGSGARESSIDELLRQTDRPARKAKSDQPRPINEKSEPVGCVRLIL